MCASPIHHVCAGGFALHSGVNALAYGFARGPNWVISQVRIAFRRGGLGMTQQLAYHWQGKSASRPYAGKGVPQIVNAHVL